MIRFAVRLTVWKFFREISEYGRSFKNRGKTTAGEQIQSPLFRRRNPRLFRSGDAEFDQWPLWGVHPQVACAVSADAAALADTPAARSPRHSVNDYRSFGAQNGQPGTGRGPGPCPAQSTPPFSPSSRRLSAPPCSAL